MNLAPPARVSSGMAASLAPLLLGLALAAAPSSARAGESAPFLRRTAAVEVVEAVGPAVVNITTKRRVEGRPFGRSGNPLFDRFFRDFFEPRLPRTTRSLGSGVVIDAEGHVLTNEHVVAKADAIRATLGDGRELDTELVGADPNNDLAVLKLVSEEEVPFVEPGTSTDLMVGEPVIAIGNPFGLSNTVTTGVLSATDRSLRTEERAFHGFLQTDASINPGNSGGPLLDATGELIGVNTAIYQDAQGIGFAIPIDVAKRVVHELITRGEVAPVWLGLDLQDVGPRIAELMEIPRRLGGALVARVRPEGPSAGSGLERGDVVTHVDGHAVRSAREFYDILERGTSGQTYRLRLWREGERREAELRAEELPPERVGEIAEQMLGLGLVPGEGGGFRVESVREGSGAAQVGLEPGDRLLGVNGRALEDAKALRRAVLDLRGRSRARVVVQRGRGRYHVTIPLR